MIFFFKETIEEKRKKNTSSQHQSSIGQDTYIHDTNQIKSKIEFFFGKIMRGDFIRGK
jgi:hypothetical protein